MSLDLKSVDKNPPYDMWLLGSILVLLSLGLVMVSSASLSYATDLGLSPWYFTLRHALYLVLGLGFGIVATYVPISFWRGIALPLLIVNFILLGILLIPGLSRPVNGSVRWLFIGPISIQISELSKLGFIIYIADYMVKYRAIIQYKSSVLMRPLLFLSVVAALLLAEPDFGATVVIVLTVLGLLFLGGVPLRQFLVLGFILGGGLGLLVWISPYRLQRLTAFLDPWSDQFKSGYQLTQSLIAFGRGSLWGNGLGNSVQKLLYLPEPHTDFIAAVLAEELGLFGICLVLMLFTVLVVRLFRLGRSALENGQLFAGYLVYGSGLWIGIQALINLGVNVGILPTKGLTLPFLSYGGNSLVLMCLTMGIVFRIAFEVSTAKLKHRAYLDPVREV